MEKRAVVILYEGNSIPDNVVGRITREIVTWCQSKDDVQVYTMNEQDIVKLLAKTVIVKDTEDATLKTTNGDIAIATIAKQFPDSIKEEGGMSFMVDLSIRMMEILDRRKNCALTLKDEKLIDAMRIVGPGCIYSTEKARKLGFTKDKYTAVATIYRRIFNNDGTFQE